MSTHSSLSPSSRHRWSMCPGSVREEAKYPSKPGGPAAIDGTHDHSLLEKCINQYHDAKTYVGMKLTDHEGEFVVDAERAERVQFALDYIEKRVAELGNEGVQVFAERRVDPAPLVGRSDMSGTVDVQILTHDLLEIIDYKGGMAPVDAKGNHQMEDYAVGTIASMPLRPLHIRMTIIQPKLRVKGMSGISTHTITLGELMQIKDKMIAEAAATDAPDAPLIAGEAQCKYCAHKGACSALSTKVLGDSGISFKGIDVVTQAADKEPTAMTDQQLREIIEAAPLLRQMIEAAEAEALRRMEQGAVIEGIKAVRGRGSRGWAIADEQEMAEKLKKMGLPKDTIWTTKLISVAQAEKATWTKRDGTVVQLSDRQLKTLKSEYTKTTEGKISVASASDPRPAVTLSAAQMFTPVVPTVELAIPSFLL